MSRALYRAIVKLHALLKIGRRNQAAAKSRESRHTGLPADLLLHSGIENVPCGLKNWPSPQTRRAPDALAEKCPSLPTPCECLPLAATPAELIRTVYARSGVLGSGDEDRRTWCKHCGSPSAGGMVPHRSLERAQDKRRVLQLPRPTRLSFGTQKPARKHFASSAT